MMIRGTFLAGLLLASLILCPVPAPACSICQPGGFTSPTFRQEAALPSARVILHGVASNPRTTADGKGQTDLNVKAVLRSNPAFKEVKSLVLPRYLPIDDGKNAPHYLVFCDVDGKKLD